MPVVATYVIDKGSNKSSAEVGVDLLSSAVLLVLVPARRSCQLTLAS